MKDIGKKIDDKTSIFDAAKLNKSDIIYYLLNQQKVINELDLSSCRELKKMAIPPPINSINDATFRWRSSLVQLSIPSTVTMIGSRAFYGCSSLKKIMIPRSVKSIGDLAFSGCSSLKIIEIPSSVESIGYQAFEECTSLEQVPIYSQLIKSINIKTFYNFHALKQIIIPPSVISIDCLAFGNCSSLTEVSLPDSLAIITTEAFDDCMMLKKVVIHNPDIKIERDAFYYRIKIIVGGKNYISKPDFASLHIFF